MSYRATPLTWCSFSPAELLMGRKIRTTVPQTSRQLTPQWPYLEEFCRLNKLHKERQMNSFDLKHGTKELPGLLDDTEVWITSPTEPIRGRVVMPAVTPRSYVVQTPTGEVRRNRSLRVVPETDSSPTMEPEGNQHPELPLQSKQIPAELQEYHRR